jgi:hypothetical protein
MMFKDLESMRVDAVDVLLPTEVLDELRLRETEIDVGSLVFARKAADYFIRLFEVMYWRPRCIIDTDQLIAWHIGTSNKWVDREHSLCGSYC